MISQFEEGEYRAPLFRYLERDSHLLWEPGQVYEKFIGLDRAIYCLDNYLFQLHGYGSYLGGAVLREQRFNRILHSKKPSKLLPDFSLNLFIQAKRATYVSKKNAKLAPHITGHHWYFEITPHQQLALESLQAELGDDGLVIYASPVFHKQQDLYNHTIGQTVVENSTFPKAVSLSGHGKWFYDKAGITGIANPDFEYFDQGSLFEQLRNMKSKDRQPSNQGYRSNVDRLAKAINITVQSQSGSFESTRFAYEQNLIIDFLDGYGLEENKLLKNVLEIEVFCYLWKLQWLTF